MKPTLQPITHKAHGRVEAVAIAYQPYIPRILSAFAVVFALSIFLYGVFLLEAVAQAASRTSAERQVNDISSQLGVLEGQYLSATKTLTPQRASALGFVTPVKVSTVVVGDNSPLSFAGR